MTEFEILTKAAQEKGWNGVKFFSIWKGYSVHVCTFTEEEEKMLGYAGMPTFLWVDNNKVVFANGEQLYDILENKIKAAN